MASDVGNRSNAFLNGCMVRAKNNNLHIWVNIDLDWEKHMKNDKNLIAVQADFCMGFLHSIIYLSLEV